MASRRSGSSGPRERPGFKRPKIKIRPAPRGPQRRAPAFPWLPVIGIVAILAVGGTIAFVLLRAGHVPPVKGTPTATLANAALTTVPTATVTPSATPVPTPTVATRPCTARADTQLHSEPDPNSTSQTLLAGREVRIIEGGTVEGGGLQWYKVLLPGYDKVFYVRSGAVECN